MGILDKIFGSTPDGPTREAEFAGVQYPREADELREAVRGHLQAAEADDTPGLRGLVAPYGDYDYAGPVMGRAYAAARSVADGVERVIVCASSPRVPFRGLAVAGFGALGFPGGALPVDLEAVEASVERELTRPVVPAFEPAAGMELQLPFVREVFGEVDLFAVLVGDGDAEEVAAFLDAFWDEETFLVVAGNLSEGLERQEAEETDRRTIAALEALDEEGVTRQSTTARLPLQGAIRAARGRNLSMSLADYRTSAETAGRDELVVGYAALLISRGP